MHLLHQILVLVHLIGFASLFGGALVQARSSQPEVNLAMVHGAWTQLVSGVLLVGQREAGLDPTVDGDLDLVKVGVKLMITLAVVVLVAKNRKFATIPRGLWVLIGAMTLVNAGVAVLWQ